MGLFDFLKNAVTPAAVFDTAKDAVFTNWSHNHDSNMMEQQKNNQLELQQQAAELAQNNWLQQFDKQTAFTKEMWNAENEYNSASAQVQRLMAAGINPSAYLGQAGLNAGAASSAGTPSPSGASGAPGNAALSSTRGFYTPISQSALALEQAKGQNITNDKLSDKISSEIEKNLATAKYQDSLTAATDLNRYVTSLKAPKEIKYLSGLIEYYAAQTAVADEQKRTEIARQLQLKSEELLNETKSKLTDKERERIEQLLPYVAQSAQQTIKESESRTAYNYASAEESRERAESERTFRTARLVGLQLDNDIKDLQKEFNAKTMSDRVAQVSRDLEATGLANRELVQKIEKAYKENNIFYLKEFGSIFKDVMQGVRDGAISLDIVRKFLEEYAASGAQGATRKFSKEMGKWFSRLEADGKQPSDGHFKNLFDKWKKNGKKF